MHVLIATDGELDPGEAAHFAAALAGPEGRVTILTVVEIPRRLLSELRNLMGEQVPVPVDTDEEYVGQAPSSTTPPTGWPGDDAMITRYLEDKKRQITKPVTAALGELGVSADRIVIEHEDAATVILDQIEILGADVLVIGSHGQGLFQGLLGSIGTKLVRRSPCPVLVVRQR